MKALGGAGTMVLGPVFVVGTADTKGQELAFLRAAVETAGASAVTVDVGTRKASRPADFPAADVAAFHPDGADAVLGCDDRGEAVSAMAQAFTRFIAARQDVGAIVGIGGGGGTSIITAGMRALPIGRPKLMVSTLASGDVGPFVGVSDITMMYSVADIAGLNRITRTVLTNAGNAIAGMAAAGPPVADERAAIGLTMFGVTTQCVTAIVDQLEADFDCVVFHATGTGGRALEKLVDSGMLGGVIDATTTEVADHLVGGVLSAGEDRLGAIARTGVPYVGSVGAVDMVNFWAMDTVPEQFRDRQLVKHNPNVTLMRTSVEENGRIGRWIADKLNACQGPVRLLLPQNGVSALDAPGQPFFDPDADNALFEAIETTLVTTPSRTVERLPLHINDPQFSVAMADAYRSLLA
jgi:uncharacterized protein (UPF0261 family)